MHDEQAFNCFTNVASTRRCAISMLFVIALPFALEMSFIRVLIACAGSGGASCNIYHFWPHIPTTLKPPYSALYSGIHDPPYTTPNTFLLCRYTTSLYKTNAFEQQMVGRAMSNNCGNQILKRNSKQTHKHIVLSLKRNSERYLDNILLTHSDNNRTTKPET